MPTVKSFTTKADIPGVFSLGVVWEPDVAESLASWHLYVELITRITVSPLTETQGTAREALHSLHSLFPLARNILREHGPGTSPSKSDGSISFGTITVRFLNNVLRPFLSHWHPRLQAHESSRPLSLSPIEHENAWNEIRALRTELEGVRVSALAVADLLAIAAGVEPLHPSRTGS